MSGVSISEGGAGLDVATVLQGGDAFMKRLAEWKAAKDEHDSAYQRLGIGQNVAEQMDLAARMTAQARAEAEAISAQALDKAAKTQKELNEFVAQARDETTAALRRAQEKEAEADRKLAAANENHDAAAQKLADADARLADVTAKQEAFANAAKVLGAVSP
jgi:hypothetical protein